MRARLYAVESLLLQTFLHLYKKPLYTLLLRRKMPLENVFISAFSLEFPRIASTEKIFV